MEYAIIFAVILAAIFATGIIDKTRSSFKTYFTKASNTMAVISQGAQAGTSGREKAGGGEVAQGMEASIADDASQGAAQGAQSGDYAGEMAKVGDMVSDAKGKLADLEDTYSKKKAAYDKIRAIPITGWFMPEFDKTREGKLLKLQMDAYKAIVETASPLTEEQ